MNKKNNNKGMLKLNRYLRLFSLLILINLILHERLHAEEESIDSYSPGYLEDIIVTAERKETHSQKTPISITTFTAEDIEDFDITQVSDLSLRTPGLTIGSAGNISFPVISLRGITSDDFSTGADLGTGFYIDDVYIGRAGNILVDLFDVERIEVLKGPQGTLWGRNTIGGAIHVITSKPTDQFETKHQFQYGNFDIFRLTGNVSGTISNKILGKFSYNIRNRNGYTDNVFFENNTNDMENISMRGGLTLPALKNSNIFLNIDYSKDRPTAAAFETVITGPVAGGAFGSVSVNDAPFNHVEPTGVFNINQDVQTQENRDAYGISLNMDFQFNQLSFNSISAFRGFNFDQKDSLDGVSIQLADIAQGTDQIQYSQEFRLSKNNDQALNWLIGTYFFHESIDDQVTLTGEDFDLLAVGDYTATNTSETISNSYSLFGQIKYNFTHRLSSTIGARYTYENKDFETARTNGFFFSAYPLKKFDRDWQAFTPKVGLEFQATEKLLYYASVSRGFRNGGFNSLQFQLEDPFDPEFLTAYEIGLKSNWFNKRLQMNLTAFYYDHRDLQVESEISVPGGGTQVVTTNAAKANSTGLEMEIQALPIERVYITGGFSFLEAKYEDFINGSGVDVSGNITHHAPKISTNIAIQYTILAYDFGMFNFIAEHQYQSKFFFTDKNEDALSQGQYHNFNARLKFNTFDEKFSFSLYGKNLTNEETINNGVDLRGTTGGINNYYNPPRTYGLEFTFQY